jgi:hypothetical protein
LHQALERHRAHERQSGQQDQRERAERCTQAGHLADEGQRDEVAGQRGEVEARAAVCLGHGDRSRGLQVEVLGGRKGDGRPHAVRHHGVTNGLDVVAGGHRDRGLLRLAGLQEERTIDR